MADRDGAIHVTGCSDVGPLIQVLGYRFENGCGHDSATLITANAGARISHRRLGIPSHQAGTVSGRQACAAFTYAYPATRVPILFREDDWLAMLPSAQCSGATLLDVLMNSENADRLYSGLHGSIPKPGVLSISRPD